MLKTIFLKTLKQSIAIYIVWYAVASFILWEFYNPFTWIINIPNYNIAERATLLFVFIIYYGSTFTYYYDKETPKP